MKILNKLWAVKLWVLTSFVLILTTTIALTQIIRFNKQQTIASTTNEPAVQSATTTQMVTISGLDLHDGMVAKFGDTYYFYGTMYGCGFEWLVTNTPWCGFGVSTAPSLSGPWSTPTLLFSPQDINYYTDTSWYTKCGATGKGCFNPRMIKRTWGPADDVYILWFNAPTIDYVKNKPNGYYAMGCNGPAGPCGAGAGAPHGTTTKPYLSVCTANGDFSIVVPPDNANPYIVCTKSDQTFAIEQLTTWGTSGTGVGANYLGELSKVESPGIYYDSPSEKWIMTFAEPNCGYCAGTGTSYATASAITGPWIVPTNTGLNPAVNGRRVISGSSCGGQPRTVSIIDGQPYEMIDLWGYWNGSYKNQTQADTVMLPLNYTPQSAENGGVLPPQFEQWPCS